MRCVSALTLFLCVVILPRLCDAASVTWNGSGADVLWSTDANWNPSGDPALGSDLVLSGGLRLTNTIDQGGAGLKYSYNSIEFAADAQGSFLIGGGTITNGAGGLSQNDVNHSQAMTNTTFVLGASQIWTVNSNDLSVLANITLGANTLTVSDDQTVHLEGSISGTGGIIKQGTGTLFISNTIGNTFTGDLVINAGTVRLDAASALTNMIGGNVIIGDGVGGAQADVLLMRANGGHIPDTSSVTINSSGLWNLTSKDEIISGLVFVGGTITNHSGGELFLNSVTSSASSVTAVFSSGNGRLNMNGGTVTFEIADGTAADDLFIGVDVRNGSLIKSGAGTMVSALNNNTYTGATTIREGTYIASFNQAMGTSAGGTVVSNGATLGFRDNVTYSATEAVTILGTGVSGVGALSNPSGNNTFAGTVTLAANSRIGTMGGTLGVSGAIDNGGFQLSVTNASGTTFTPSGGISGTGGLLHSGSGTLALTAANTFSGAFTNLAGTVSVSQATALTTASSLYVGGGTLLYNVGNTNTNLGVTLNGGEIKEVDMNTSLGALTLSANSTVTLNSGGSAGSFRFASATNTVGAGAQLVILNWTGTVAGGTDDLIFFTTSTAVTSTFLNNVLFMGVGYGSQILPSGELVPITPEPSTLLSGGILLGMFGSRFWVAWIARIRSWFGQKVG